MGRRATWSVPLVLLCVAAPALFAPTAASQPAREPTVAIAADGQGTGGRIEAHVEIAAPSDIVWRVMLDCGASLRIVAGLTRCKVLAKDPAGRWDIREHTVAWAAFLPTVRNVFRSEYHPTSLIRFTRIDGDLRRLEGTWRLHAREANRSTLLLYMADVDLGLPLPRALLRSTIESDVRRVLKAVQREAEAQSGR